MAEAPALQIEFAGEWCTLDPAKPFVIGREGVKDVGFRVVVGGGVGAGQAGGTHDVDSMDFSLVSAL